MFLWFYKKGCENDITQTTLLLEFSESFFHSILLELTRTNKVSSKQITRTPHNF